MITWPPVGMQLNMFVSYPCMFASNALDSSPTTAAAAAAAAAGGGGGGEGWMEE